MGSPSALVSSDAMLVSVTSYYEVNKKRPCEEDHSGAWEIFSS